MSDEKLIKNLRNPIDTDWVSFDTRINEQRATAADRIERLTKERDELRAVVVEAIDFLNREYAVNDDSGRTVEFVATNIHNKLCNALAATQDGGEG